MRDEPFFTVPQLPFAEYRASRHCTRTYTPHMQRCFSIGAIERGEILYRLCAWIFRIEKFTGGMLAVFGLLLAFD